MCHCGVTAVFARTKTVKGGGREHQQYQLVKGRCKDGRIRQKMLMTLGCVDALDCSRVDGIVSALEGYTCKVDVLFSMDDCHYVWPKGIRQRVCYGETLA